MKIRILGFEWHMAKGITISDYCNYLESISGKEFAKRVIAVTEKDGLWVGILLTIKDMKAYCEMKDEKGGFVISPKELDRSTHIADFNFFIIHPETGRGLYQHYHNSPVINTFCTFCKQRYDDLKSEIIKDESRRLGNVDEAQKQQIIKKYEGSLRYSLPMTEKDFLQCVNGLKKINNIIFENSCFTETEKIFSPLGPYAKRMTHKVVFPKSKKIASAQLLNDIKHAITEMIPNLKGARLKGVDPEGNEAIYKLINDYNPFAEFEYEEIIRTVNLDSTNLLGSIRDAYFIDRMIEISKRPNVSAILSVNAK